MTLALDDPEGEAAPLQRIRYAHDMGAYFVSRQFAVIDRREFHISRIADGMPYELSITVVVEPTAERVMPTQVCVDGVIHGSNVTLAGYFTGSDDLPRKVQPRGCPFVIITKMLALHVADRHRTGRRSSDPFGSRGRRVPGDD
jgi:hypothetical protein